MIAAALLVAALAQDAVTLESAPRAVARWLEPPTAVELGVPFELVLEVTHEPGGELEVGPGELASDVAWAVLDAAAPLVLPDLDDPRLRVSELRWTVVALEPGLRMLPRPELRYGGEPLAPSKAGLLDVSAVLAPGEDAPRPLPPDLGLSDPAAARRGLGAALIVAGGALLVGLAVWLARRGARRPRPALERAPSPLERLAALEQAPLEDPRSVREAHLELTRALRQHLDGATPRDALTDEEWLAALALPADGELGRLFAECRPVEYGGERPTHWATRERVARARALAERQGVGA